MILFYYTNAQQNLVPNGNFETYTNCPQNTNQIYYAYPWFQPNYYDGSFATSSSTDFYHICSVGIVGVPLNYFGFQFAKSGDGYAGIGMYVCYNNDTSCINNDTSTFGREYLEVKLIQALKKQNKYCFSMYVSLS